MEQDTRTVIAEEGTAVVHNESVVNSLQQGPGTSQMEGTEILGTTVSNLEGSAVLVKKQGNSDIADVEQSVGQDANAAIMETLGNAVIMETEPTYSNVMAIIKGTMPETNLTLGGNNPPPATDKGEPSSQATPKRVYKKKKPKKSPKPLADTTDLPKPVTSPNPAAKVNSTHLALKFIYVEQYP